MAAATSLMMKEPRQIPDIALDVLDNLGAKGKIILNVLHLYLGLQTFLVTGGGPPGNGLSSTELLVETASAWVLTGDLPSPRIGLRGANIDNKIMMTGNTLSNNEIILMIYEEFT